MSKKRILITGANGFIGKHLLQHFATETADIGALVRDQALYLENRSAIKHLQADLLNFTVLRQKVWDFKPDIVYHLAGQKPSGRGWNSIQQAYQNNLIGTMNLLRALENIDTQAIILMGSAAEYGKGTAPYHEEQGLRPVSAYGASKAAANSLGLLCHEYFKLPIIVLRPTVVYGPGQGNHLFLSQLCKTILQQKRFSMSPGEQYRDFIYVSDVVEALILAATTSEAIGGTFNIGLGISYPLKYIAEVACRYIGNNALLQIGTKNYSPEEQFAYCVDTHLAQQVLKWKPRVTLEHGLATTVDWYKSNGAEK